MMPPEQFDFSSRGGHLRSGCLKVKTLNESLLSCCDHASPSTKSLGLIGGSLSRSLHAVRSIGNILPKRARQRRHHSFTEFNPLQAPGYFLDNSQRTCTNEQDLKEEYRLRDDCRRARPIDKNVSVTFHQVEIREYKMALTDNPAVPRGPALGLGWDYEKKAIMSVDEYESTQRPKIPPTNVELKVPEFERIKILRRSGFDEKQIRRAADLCARGRNQRHKTVRKINKAVADGKLKEFDNHIPLLRKLLRVVPCFRCRRESKLTRAHAY